MVREYWFHGNGPVEEAGVTNSCEEQRVYWCKCWRHTSLRTTKNLVSRHSEGIECKICAKAADSHVELIARGALQQAGVSFQVYVKPLGHKFGPVDIYIPAANFIVAVDGPGHMEEDCRSVPLHVQQAIDKRFDDESMRQGFYLLRMHYRDVEFNDTLKYVREGLKFAERRHQGFVMYSKRYREAGWLPRGFPHLP